MGLWRFLFSRNLGPLSSSSLKKGFLVVKVSTVTIIVRLIVVCCDRENVDIFCLADGGTIMGSTLKLTSVSLVSSVSVLP